jgi:hypothetical protein
VIGRQAEQSRQERVVALPEEVSISVFVGMEPLVDRGAGLGDRPGLSKVGTLDGDPQVRH